MTNELAVRSRNLLARLLEQPRLVAAVQALPPRSLLALIDHVGLEDAGEIVAMATVEQLQHMFDDDLWRDDGRFDPARFTLWLEVMLEAGSNTAADTLADLDEGLLALALDAQVLVLDLDEVTLSAIDAELEKQLESGPYVDFDQYRVIGRGADGWDAIAAALAALDERHTDVSRRVLEQLSRAASEWIRDNGGLHSVLTSSEMFAEDAAADREDRRARAGHVSAASARAFLRLPGAADDVQRVLDEPRDAITRAYFREYQAPETDAPERVTTWLEEQTGEQASRPLLDGKSSESGAEAETLLRRTLAGLDESVARERLRELAYLANVLVAASPRHLRPLDAANQALAICDAGLSRAVAATGRSARDLLTRTGCEKLFRLGQ